MEFVRRSVFRDYFLEITSSMCQTADERLGTHPNTAEWNKHQRESLCSHFWIKFAEDVFHAEVEQRVMGLQLKEGTIRRQVSGTDSFQLLSPGLWLTPTPHQTHFNSLFVFYHLQQAKTGKYKWLQIIIDKYKWLEVTSEKHEVTTELQIVKVIASDYICLEVIKGNNR